ncbi:hypothetical protein SAMN05443579_11081 [Variovorax sp. PDC80]|uniref:hypothetical protein n=1 Tax=Variovorax sp. PDC80 TaxID=1882827 RepID=UPI0008E040DE|nr:hypothetical protein [Variovorax sp. PDC80]SFP30072.1 hypothetical protein SAMN05443579_11081 [Variovorax sp. PDC80]
MDNIILDVVLGLLLIYLVMALLVSKVQEVWAGQLRSGRTHTMHSMLLEGVGRDKRLKDKILESPMIFALSRGDNPASERGGWTSLWSAQGPSAIPPDLFAKALLVELYDDGKSNPPSVRYTPDAFVKEVGAGSTDRIWGTLRSLLPGNEGNWSGFEAAIAGWYKAIGERADGWYQRSAQTWSFYLALALACLLNVDSFHIAERLANEPDLRRSVSTLAQNVSAFVVPGQGQERADTKREGSASQAAVLPPDLRAEQALQRAASLIGDTYFRHEDFAKFDPNVADIAERSSVPKDQGQNINRQPLEADNDLPLIAGCARTRVTVSNLTKNPTKDPTKSSKRPPEPIYLSNPLSWMYLMKMLDTEIKILRRPQGFNPAEADKSAPLLRWVSVYDCVANLSGFVALAAQRPPKEISAQENLRLALVSLNSATDSLLEVVRDQNVPLSFMRLFQIDPDVFTDCSDDPSMSREGLRRCVLAAQDGRINLPLGWTGPNRRLSFCHPVVVERTTGSASGARATPGSWVDGICGSRREFSGNEALRIPPMRLEGPGFWEILAFVAGLLVTAFFVALGSPLWFDLLGRVVKLRSAGGKARDDSLGEPSSGRGERSPTGGAGAPAGGSSEDPFSLARNEIERRLPAGDLIALQGALGVERNGVWDKATRQRMAEESRRLGLGDSDELTNQLYLALLGRSPAGLTMLQPPTSSLKLHAEDPRCAEAASALMGILAFPNRLTPLPKEMTDDLRALAVLWRYKKRSAALPHDRMVQFLPQDKHALDDISASELAEILDQARRTPPITYPRESAPWLDWALGEIGQAEAQDPAATTSELSNPRILEYLSVTKQTAAEAVPWCASFASWVLTRYDSTRPVQAPSVAAASARADYFGGPGSTYGVSIWVNHGAAAWPASVQAGDVVSMHLSTGHEGVNHMGFVLATDAAGAWAISGNYSNRVCIAYFKLADIVEVRRP